MLNAVLLIVCVCIVLVLLFYLFYWNRFLAFITSLILRLALWNQGESSIWVEFGAINFSTLAGRLMIKDLRYHSSNQTFRIVKFQMSWRYWLRRPAEEEDLSHARVIGEDANGKHSPLGCRVHISLQGLEWFMYNRTSAYDNIVSYFDIDMPTNSPPTPVPDGAASVRKKFSRTSLFHDSAILAPPVSLVSSIYQKTPTFIKTASHWLRRQMPTLDPKDLLPISIEVTKGAITIGNASTPNLLVAEFQRAEGTYGTVEARSKRDLYKQVLNMKLHNPSVLYVDNEAYTSPMDEVGQKTHGRVNRSDSALRRASYLSFHSFGRVWQRLKLWNAVSVYPRSSHHAMQMTHPQTWGRRRQQKHVDDDTPLGADFTTLEYAIERKILEASVVELLYYADVVGVVPPATTVQERQDDDNLDPFDIGNGDLPPEWGMDLVIRGGFIRYGPWADRQRVVLQHVFFPPVFLNSRPTPRLKPGDMRMWTGLKVLIELRDGVTLQIPFREVSKNWQWDGKVDVNNRPRKREAASIHVRVGDSSTISYIVPMIASSRGYISLLEVHLDTVTVTSSLNDIRLLTAETCRIRSNLPAPLKWNGLRQWTFAISLRQPIFCLLRDHINMLTDLSKDWSSGPPGDYNLFTPMIYVIDLDMHNYIIDFYVNDHNIIDKPLLREENAFLTLRGTRFTNGTRMPLTKYRPEANTVSFWIEMPDVYVDLSLPRWNITSLYPTPDRNQVGHIGMLNMTGSYRYFSEVREEHVDSLKLKFVARDVVYKAFGWTLRYFMILRENYFGSFTHFSTLTEYLGKRKSGQPPGDPIHQQYRRGQSNTMQVTVGLEGDNVTIVVPAGIPGFEKYSIEHSRNSPEDLGPCLLLSLPVLQLHLRSNDYYMEMSMDIDTIYGRISEHSYNASMFSMSNHHGNKREKIVIDGLDITAYRLFGHRPATATYVCIWEIHFGDIKAAVNSFEARLLSAVGTSFGLNFSDPLNAPAKEYAIPSDPDVTFLKVRVDAVNVVWVAGNAAAELTLPAGLRIDMNDLAGKTFRRVTGVRLPEGAVKLLLSSKQNRTRWIEAADAHFDVDTDIYYAPPGWRESARLQIEFVAAQDAITGRAKILYTPEDPSNHDQLLRPGRGIIDNDFYLPQIRVPRLQSRDTLGNHATPLPSLREDMSEADIDPLPDAVRDARVAHLRPVNVGVDIPSDLDDFSSGDESDDDDLTDWSTEYEDTIDEASLESPWPPVKPYASLCRHYEGFSVSRPSSWELSPFTLVRDQNVACNNHTPFDIPARGDDPDLASMLPLLSIEAGQEDLERCAATIFRAHSREGVRFWITPLILPVVSQLLTHLGASQLSPELRFDALTAKYIKAFKARPGPLGVRTIFDLHVPKIQVRTAQVVNAASPREVPMASRQTPLSPQPGESFVTVVECLVGGLCLRGRSRSGASKFKEKDFGVAFSSFSLALIAKSPSRTYKGGSEQLCQLSIGPTCASIIRRDIVVSLGAISSHIGHNGPDFVLTTVVVLARFAGGVALAQRTSGGHTRASDRQIIHAVLSYSQERSIVDPLSTIQPSFLVQSGLPDQLRKGIALKFLVYLRSSLRFMNDRERHMINNFRSDVSTEDLIESLQTRWADLAGDDDSTNLSQQSVLQDVLHASQDVDNSSSSAFWESRLESMSLTLAGMHLALRHPVEALESNFKSGPAIITAHRQLGNLVQSTVWSPGKSPNLPIKDKENHNRNLLRISLSLSLDHISSTVHPQLVEFMQIVLRDYRHRGTRLHATLRNVSERSPPSSRLSDTPRELPPILSIDSTLVMRSFAFTAATEQLIVRFKNADVVYAASSLFSPPTPEQPTWDISTNHSLMLASAAFEACSDTHQAKPREHILASLTFGDIRANVVLQQDVHRCVIFRTFIGMKTVHLDVPRSALRLYRFVEGWRADYLPGIDATVRGLLMELHRLSPAPSRTPSQSLHPPKPLTFTFQVQASVESVRATLQVMHGTWLTWEVRDTLAFVLNDSRKKGALIFGLQMGPHVFLISRSRSGSQPGNGSGIRLELPTVTLRGRHDSTGLHGLALVEFFQMTLRPSDWDTLLSVQQKSGQDFTDLIHIIEQSRQKRPSPASPARRTTDKHDKKPSFIFAGSLKMKGFRIGLEGVTSMLFLECEDISGGTGNHGRSLWHVRLSDLALSMASQAAVGTPSHRDRRSAFVRMDIEAEMGGKSQSPVQHLQVSISKIHAVMQPSSIGELGDFIDHLQAEVLIRKEQRATELEEFKEKTRSLMKSLDVKIGEQSTSQKFLFERYTISLMIKNIGVAFPLSFARDLHMHHHGSQDGSAVRAFLFSIKTLEFGTQVGENGQASMTGFSFQFVSRFRQGNPADFSGENHKTRNKLVYPEMTAHLRSERVAGSRRVCIGAEVSGFVLDVDSTIPDFVSSLLDVYRRGKDRVERLANTASRTSPHSESGPHIKPAEAQEQYGALPTSNILASLTFASGKVRMYSRESSPHRPRSRPLTALLYGRTDSDSNGAEEFNLPVVSVWAEFKATPAVQKLSAKQPLEPSTLVFKSTIHSSQNTLRPSLLPFITELMANIEDHMRTTHHRGPRGSPGPRPHGVSLPVFPIASVEETLGRTSDSASSTKISFSLRIDQSRLILTCRPDANVIAGLHWDSGGFIVNIAPGARRVTFTGTVGGLTVSLKHGFLSEDCVKLDARNLNFTIAFAKTHTIGTVSVVLDTEFSGGLRCSRLQDVLCFKAVWLDRIPAFNSGSNQTPTERSSNVPTSALPTPVLPLVPAKQEITTAVLLRLRCVELDVDLGQSISTVKLTMDNTLVRTKITETLSELSLAIGHFSIAAFGNLAGYADMPDFHFQTIRRNNHRYAREAGARMLDLAMTSGVFTVKLESEYHELIQYRAEPISIHIYDDWSQISSDIPKENRRVTLDFVVTGTDVLAIMTIGTVPKLVSYVNKFRMNLETQREGAIRESKAFRIASAPKPDNPLSAVANAMFKSARSRLLEHETGLSYAFGQRMSLKLKILRLVVFPRSMRDQELAQFVGEDVHARLHRYIQASDEPAKRDLQLYFSGITISKISHLHLTLVPKEESLDCREWLSKVVANSPEAIIFGLPSMDMQMCSEETQQTEEDGEKRVLTYDFSSSFSKAGAKDAEDIYISLNMSLYSWLTVLRKTFAREMVQVHVSADTRVATLGIRKKQDSPTVSSIPSEGGDGSTLESSGNRTRLRGRGSISLRPIPLTVHSMDDVSEADPHTHVGAKASTSASSSLKPRSQTTALPIAPVDTPAPTAPSPGGAVKGKKTTAVVVYAPRTRRIERLTMRQLGDATPDVMHPFFMKKAGFSLEDSLPQYVHEYATMPTEEIMKALLKLYSKQLTSANEMPLSPRL